MKTLNFLTKLASWGEELSARIRPVGVSYPGSESFAVPTERRARDDREMSERRTATQSGARVAQEWLQKSSARVAQGLRKSVRFAATILVLLWIGVGNVWGADVTFTAGTDVNATKTITKSSVTLTLSSACPNLNGYSEYRIYSGAKFTISSSSNITAISVTTNTDKGNATKLSASVSGYTASGTSGSWSGETKSIDFTADGQVRVTKIVVTTAGASYTITATRNNDSYGTVSVTGTTITATPNSGYRVMSGTDGYTVTSGTATVVNNGDNTFTVTPSSNCTVQINFESKGCTDHYGTNVVSGASTAHEYGPIDPYYEYSTRQILYTKTDLGLAAGKKGTIKSISFQYAYSSALTGTNSVKIYMANTNLTELSTSKYVTSFTEVYSGAYNCSGNGVYNEIMLDEPFEYDGVGNLVVIIDDNSNKDEGYSPVFNYHTADPAPTYAQLYTRSASTNADPTAAATWTGATATNYRPNTKFCIQEADMTPATVTLMDNGAELTEASAGAGVTLPSRTGCTDYTFAGWTKTWVAPQSSWTTTAPTIIPAGSYTPSANENLYPVYTKTEGEEEEETEIFATTSLGSTNTVTTGYAVSAAAEAKSGYYQDGSGTTRSVSVSKSSTATAMISSIPTIATVTAKLGGGTTKDPLTNNVYAVWLDASGNELGDAVQITSKITNTTGSDFTANLPVANATSAYGVRIKHQKETSYNVRYYAISLSITTGGSTTSYISVPGCCTDPELAYGTAPVTKTYGEGVFTNTLTNSHSVGVTYDSSDKTVATVDSEGEVTILKVGSTTITASSAAQTVAAVSYCADEASYTLTVNKANISPTLTYTPNSVAVGESTSAPTVGGNPGSGGVTYAITSATPAGCATINTSTGVVTGVAVGSVTVTATIAATDNYNGGTATANVTIHAASYFPNGKTIFIQAESSSAWSDANYDCVKAWFHTAGGSETAQTTYWLFDATGGDSGKKLFAAIVPATGDLPYLDIQRFTHDCSYWRNKNGGCSYSDANGSNTIRSTGNTDTYDAQDDYIRWNATGVTMNLMSSDAWLTPVASMTDQGSGIWSGTYEYTPSNTSTEYVIATNYNGNIGNTGSNSNATLSGMVVGSTYDVTATLDIKDHSLEMSKTFVKGEVSFDLQGHGSAISKLTNVTAGSKISAPSPAPSVTGWDFGGWYKEPAFTNAWNFGSDVVNETMTLYAKWTKQTYTITSTLNNCSSSPAIPSSYEYTGSAASLSYTITPSSGYRLPTEITVSGTTYTWNPATGALALTGTISSNVTITITAVQTHTVDWYVGGSAPANKIGDDGQTTVVDHGGKIEDFPATTPDGSACEKTFVGWTDDASYPSSGTLFNDVAGSPTINADASFYAVFAEIGADYELVTSSSSSALADGDEIIIANAGVAGSGGVLGYSRGNNRATVDVTIASGPKIANPTLATINTDEDHIYPLQLIANSTYFNIKDKVNNQYLAATGASSSNYLALLADGNDDRAKFSISVAADGEATIVSQQSGTRDHLRHNNSNNPPIFACYATGGQSAVYIYRKSLSGYTINCADCGTSVTPTYTAAPTGGTVSVTKSASPVASGSTVKTCSSVDLSVTITPASHYTLTGFTATGLSTGTATISPAVNTVVPTTSAQTFTVTVSAGATGTLNLTPTLEEDAHKVISWVVHGGSASIADGHGTTWVYSGENLTGIPSDPSAPAGCVDKEFVGWSEYDGGATEGDASDYTDLFTTLGGAPTGITTNRTFYAVFATPAAGMGGTVMWDEPWTGATAGTQPSGTTGYNSTAITYSYSESGCKIYDDVLAGGTSPELLVKESGGNFTASNIPAAGQTSLTLTYKSNKSLTVSTNTTGVTVGDADVDGSTYTRTITIDQSGLGVANFDLVFTKTAKSNARLDDIHVAVPGSSSMSGYVTTCEDTWTVTYYKNTEDAVTNLPSPTGISKSTGSGTLSSKVPVRYGYTFDGWAISAGGSVVYAAGAAVSSVSADMDLYAKWSVTPVTEINLSKTSLDKYVGDPSVTLSVLSVLPDGANTSVTWSSSNSSIATVNSSTGEVNFIAQGTADIIATSTVTNTTTATCVVTVWAKPTATFLDNMHGLTVDENSVALSSYNLEAAAGTAVVFPTLANQIAGSGTCEDEHYIFVGWTTSDNNDDPEDHLVSSYTLTNGDAITYYAVWADGVSGTTYVKLTDNSFSTSKHYVIGAVHPDNGTTYYFNSCAQTDKDNSWGYVTADLASNTPIEFTLSGTASALVATTTESTSRYLKPTSTNEFHMSSTSQTIMLKSDGKIYSTDETRRLLFNKSQPGLRWYGIGIISGSSNAYFYEVVAGGEVDYRTSCCADKVPAPTVTATQTSVSVTLNWNDLSGSGATGYEVSWNDGAWTSPSGTRTHSVSGLTPNTTYTWKVRATYTTPKCGADIASGSTTTNQVYHVTYAKGSGTGSCNATGSTTDGTAYEAGATVTLQSNGFTLVGHTFNEWTEDDEDITISSNQFTMPEHDVVITATWTPKVDKFYDRMHDGTDASHGGIADGDGKYYITREGCSYTVPSLTDNTSGATACHTKHYVLMGWTAESHLNSDGTLKTGHEGNVYTGGGTQTATGATYYAVWAEVEE